MKHDGNPWYAHQPYGITEADLVKILTVKISKEFEEQIDRAARQDRISKVEARTARDDPVRRSSRPLAKAAYAG